MKTIAVYCGSREGVSPIYIEAAGKLGAELAKEGVTLVYGGASIGVMGAVADAVLEAGGKAIGVIPHLLADREVAHQHLTDLIVVDTMHERKAKMIELADAFIALPGGAGTMEEFFEVFTWSQIGLHNKPFGLLNVNQYYDKLISFIKNMLTEEFLREEHFHMVLEDNEPKRLLEKFAAFQAARVRLKQ